MKFLVTGGAGFIGSALIRYLMEETDHEVLNLDKLTYAGNLISLALVAENERYRFIRANICDAVAIRNICEDFEPDKIIHLAAESHVDRSVDSPGDFVQTNVVGTYVLLDQARQYWETLKGRRKKDFVFHHVSTDEVFGSLGKRGLFTERSAYKPNSPYSASKASSDHLVRAWYETYGLPIVITNCSNNYGPYQFPEKLVPLIILNALDGKPLPVYGAGDQIRDWLYVEDHARALYQVATEARKGQTYNIGGHNEMKNIDVVNTICQILEESNVKKPPGVDQYTSLIKYVEDRPGHDKRYAINASKIEKSLGWKPAEDFDSGLRKTIAWYIDNRQWCEQVQQDNYDRSRLGLKKK